jgi:hypothetical protein
MIRHMLSRLLSLAFAVTGFTGTATAQTMEFDCPKPGTTFVFDSGTNIVAHGRDGSDCKMEIVGGKPFKVRGLLFDNPAADGSDKSAFIAALKPERLWPLSIGKKIEATYSVGGRSWTYILTVARYEKRMGPDDALFDAFVIEMNEQGDKGERSVSRWWVSPVEKYALRFDWSNSTGAANRAIVTTVKH